MAGDSSGKSGPKTRASLTPGERRDAEREKIRKEIDSASAQARKLRADLKDVKTKVTEEDPGKEGRIMEPERVATMIKPLKDVAEQNVLFEPNEGPQTEFLAAPETDVLYGGQAGGGKSYSLIVDPLRYAHRPAHRALLLRKTLSELGELIDNSRELYPLAFPGAKYIETKKMWQFPSGAKLIFGYLEKESDVYQYQGRAFSWIGFDELTHLPTEFAWNYLASRLRTTDPEIQCYMRATTNPGGVGHNWVKKRYIDVAKPNTPYLYGTNPQTGKPLTRKFIPAKLSDNPYLYERGDYQAMLETLPEIERRRLLMGDWDVNEGVAFPEFSREHHVIDPFDIPSSWNRVKAVDYGYSAPSCCLWAAIDPDEETVIVYRELYERQLTAEMLGERMNQLEVNEFRAIPGVLDGAAWNKTGYTGPTIGETLTRRPYNHKLRPADKNRIAGKVQIHERLKVVEGKRPKLLIFNTCKNLIDELLTLPLSETNSEDVDTKAPDHAYDALRYLIMSRPRKETTDEALFRFKTEIGYEPVDRDFGY